MNSQAAYVLLMLLVCCSTPGAAELGSALGPDWHQDISLRGAEEVCECGYLYRNISLYILSIGDNFIISFFQVSHNVHVEYECEIEAVHSRQDFMQSPLYTQNSDLGNIIRALYHIYLGDQYHPKAIYNLKMHSTVVCISQ